MLKNAFIKRMFYALFFTISFFMFAAESKALDEYKLISATKTSMHTYIYNANFGASSTLVTYNSMSYKEITSSYTFVASEGFPKAIGRISVNVFAAFKTNKTYKVVFAIGVPSKFDFENYVCTAGSYTNNTAWPPYSVTNDCSITRSSDTEILVSTNLTIEQGQYVTVNIVPKIGIDTTKVYDMLTDNLPPCLNANFTLRYGDIKIYEQISVSDKVDDVNDKITDDNIDTSNSNSFFGNFSDQEHGSISSIITAPLKAINRITDKCTSLKFTIFEQEIEIPCGDTLFWDKTEVSEFRLFWNIFFGGAIIYALLVKLYHVIESLKNPDDSRIEVLKL